MLTIGVKQAISRKSKYRNKTGLSAGDTDLIPIFSNLFRKKGSSMRHKLQQLTMSIVNLTHLMETVTQMTAKPSSH